ncbi:MAG: type II toxin-antitoxin system VapC family toxin [Betaproteobacteria bacterium]|nr:type II toxin-antitoxin system VapC family toxin [Betaproteobacteria bacterium]
MGQTVKILLDSVILIDHLNGHEQATQYISQHAGIIAISVITRAEVLVGVHPDARAKVRRLLESFPNLPISTKIADLAASLRRKHRWKLPDALQAALAKNHKLRLATRDSRDFRPSVHRFVVIPYQLHSS